MFKSKQREAVNSQFLFVSMIMSITILFKSLVEIESRLHCIDENADHWIIEGV